MQTINLFITLELVSGQIQVTTGTVPSGIDPGDAIELIVTAGSGLTGPTLHTIQFFSAVDGQPGPMEAIWARIGQTEGMFTTSGLIFAAMQASSDLASATFTNINVTPLPQDAFFTCGGFVTEGETVPHSWVLDPEVILRSGEWV